MYTDVSRVTAALAILLVEVCLVYNVLELLSSKESPRGTRLTK